MRMRIPVACALALWLIAPLVGAADKTPEEILNSKGLTKAGITWVLQDDITLPEGLRTMRATKTRVDQNTSKRENLERQIKNANSAIAQWKVQFEDIVRRKAGVNQQDVRRYNQYVDQGNILLGYQRDAEQFIEQKEKELAALSDPRDSYITSVLELSEQMEATAKKYEELAADPQVKQAIVKLNESGRGKQRLGPSPQFAAELPRVRKQRGMIVSAPVKIQVLGGTPRLMVTLNGKLSQIMILDSGAADVSITREMATKAGITPQPTDQTVIRVLADGRQVEAKLIVLKTVQVGQFVAHDVECVVMPDSVKEADGLLGDSFLRHFVYKMDLNAGELHMSQLASSSVPQNANIRATTRPWTKSPLRAAAPAKGKGEPFAIPSSESWTETAFNVTEGQCYEIRARGKWTGLIGPAAGPEGLCPPELFAVLGPQPGLTHEQRESSFLGQHPRNALIGRIGSAEWTFYVGPACRFIAPVSGPLSFRINDINSPSAARNGRIDVTIAPAVPEWLTHNGLCEILARVDDVDLLHISPKGMSWEWGGGWAKVGQHEGTWPTVINGTFWWPKWIDAKHTDTLPATDLWPHDIKHFQIERVEARRGKVELTARTADEIVLRFHDDGLGSSQVGCVVATGNPYRSPEQRTVEDGWTVLFRSADAGNWNSVVHDSNSYAAALEAVPDTMRYLRMRIPTGDSVIIPLTNKELKTKARHGNWGWEGRSYDICHAHHLGIYLPALPRAQTGSVDITQIPGAGYTGYGFGNRVNKDDVQGYVWDGKSIGRTVFEISFTTRDLTPAEQARVLSE